MLTVHAPAKINLVLEALGKYDDYHQISSILQTINLYDILNFKLSQELSLKCNEPSLEYNNLVLAAAMLLKRETRYGRGAQIELCKNIPWGVGLGGGSSDAAATLLTLNKLWGLKLPLPKLVHLAAKLGSDVPFFIYGGTALAERKGERITPLPSLSPTCFALLVPPIPKIHDKTKHLYAKLNASYFTKGQFARAALTSLRQEKTIPPPLLFNVFEKVAFDSFPNLANYKKSFEEAGASSVHLAGSGPCLFAPAHKEGEANKLCLRLRKQGLECYVALSLPKVAR